MTANVQPEGDSGMSEMKRRHARQRLVSMVAGPLWVGISVFAMRFWYRYRIADVDGIRAQYRAIRAQSDAPMLICANHLTLVDSFLATWALGSGAYWVTHPDELAWNTPESTNFGRTRRHRLAIFLAKCIPITRGGAREEVAGVLDRVRHLLVNGETALIFPEAGRSRTGRVEESSAAWGVGRIVGSVPGCRVLCVYMRGTAQETWGDFPKARDTMHVSMACIEPKSDTRGVRRSRDLGQQIVRQLQCMEEEYFDAR
jgi:1-acyl-sn-glycerol-3-phosphate acyltransferase